MTHNVYWLLSDADAQLVATVRGSDGGAEDSARVAKALARAREPGANAELEADALVQAGLAAAARAKLSLSAVSSSTRLRALLEAAGGKVPGLLVMVVCDHDEDVSKELKRLGRLGVCTTVHRRPAPELSPEG